MNLIKLILLLGLLSSKPANKPPEDALCGIRNTTTKGGEEISYSVYYALAGIYVEAGWARFSNTLETFEGRPVYHAVGTGGSHESYDWIYKVRDRYESFIDTASMKPLQFSRDVSEGSTKKKETVKFYHAAGTALSGKTTIKIPYCVQDVQSMVYNARNIDFSKYKKNDRIPFNLFLENEVHALYLRYLGKETVKTRYGTFKAIKFRPLLVAGTIFNGGEDMTVWVSDDALKVPVRIESKILVGSIKVDMMGYKGLRGPLSGLVKKK